MLERLGEPSEVADAVLRTRQFAVRQERWFRRDARIRWLDGDSRSAADVAAEIVGGLAASPA